MIFSLIFLYLSLIFGIYENSTNFFLWLIFGIIGLSCIYFGISEHWKYIIKLGIIYIFIGVGIFLLYTDNIFLKFIGIIFEIFAVYILIKFLLEIVNLRKKYIYQPFGLWFLSVFLFFLFANISFIDFMEWINNRGNLLMYIFSESVLIILFVHILFYPSIKLT